MQDIRSARCIPYGLHIMESRTRILAFQIVTESTLFVYINGTQMLPTTMRLFWYIMVFVEKGLTFAESEMRWGGSSKERILCHCCFRPPGEEFQIGPKRDLSKALNNGYRLLLCRIERYPGCFGFLLIKIHLLGFGFVTVKWVRRPNTQKNLFFLNPAFESCTKQPCSAIIGFTCLPLSYNRIL